jgi:hypothetical protein
MLRMLRRDAVMYPTPQNGKVSKKSKKRKKSANAEGMSVREGNKETAHEPLLDVPKDLQLAVISDEALKAARGMIIAEDGTRPLCEEGLALLVKAHESAYEAKAVDDFPQTFARLNRLTAKARERASKLARRADVRLKGYGIRKATICSEITEMQSQLEARETDKHCFVALSEKEGSALPNRLKRIRRMVAQQKDTERSLQTRYAKLEAEHRQLWSELHAQ